MRHGLRIAVIWLVVSVIVEILIAVLPIPLPTGSVEAMGGRQTMYMLFYVGAPVFVFVWVLLVYNLVTFRYRPGEDTEPVAPPDSTPILLLWAGLSFVIVLFMAGWGTFTLHEITEPPPAAEAASTTSTGTHGHTYVASIEKPGQALDIQVIGQEWMWTFRYPTYGGMETRDLYVPVNTLIRLHITSLDVVHSFWTYDYDIKEDAVPGIENTAWFWPRTLGEPTDNGKNWVKCNELCGIWHGYMRAGIHVIPQSAFLTWAKQQYAFEKSSGFLKNLPPYASVYYPAANSNWPTPPQDQSP
ncbi:MAG TPA: cytochrome c oxidase subunit II [Chloroflexota bacterium]|nr:cytochrome c oxidase subunit II [Chloroflexota bacterium]